MASYASTASNTPQSIAGSYLPDSPSLNLLSPAAATATEKIQEPSLEEREAALAALLADAQLKHAEISERMRELYDRQAEKLQHLRMMEKQLSSQAGSLLKRLQSEEAATAQLSSTIKRYKSDHKKLLTKIANPKWEIAHHYHMTVLEHHLGHRQPHVLDVAELLPGHLRIYSLARVSSLYKRGLMYYSAKSKADRNSVSESIQESYKRLREVRKEMKEIQKMMELMKEKSRSLAAAARASNANNPNNAGITGSGGSGANASSAGGLPLLKLERQESERNLDEKDLSPSPTPTASDSALASLDSPSASTPTAASTTSTRPTPTTTTPSTGASRGPGPVGNAAQDALMRQRRRMLGMNGPGGGPGGGPGQRGGGGGPGISSRGGPGISTASASSSLTSPTAASTTTSSIETDSLSTALDSLDIAPQSSPTLASTPSTSSSSSSSSSSSQSNYRMKYFKTLNLAPKLDFLNSHLPTSSAAEQKKEMAENYNADMKNIHALLASLESSNKEQKEKAQQLQMLQQYRKRMGVESLPLPHFDAADGGGSGGAAATSASAGGNNNSGAESPRFGGNDPDSDTEGSGPIFSAAAAAKLLASPPASPSLHPSGYNSNAASPAITAVAGREDASADQFSLDAPSSPSASIGSSSGVTRSQPLPISGSASTSSSSRIREKDKEREREREKRKSASQQAAAAAAEPPAPQVTLFSSQRPGKSSPSTSGGEAAAPLTSSTGATRTHSSRAGVSSRGLGVNNRAEDHGR